MTQTSQKLAQFVEEIASELCNRSFIDPFSQFRTLPEGKIILFNSEKYTIILEKHSSHKFRSRLDFHGKKYCFMTELFTGLGTRGKKTYDIRGVITSRIELFVSDEFPTYIETLPDARTVSIFTNKLE